jgi:hypothetical protein
MAAPWTGGRKLTRQRERWAYECESGAEAARLLKMRAATGSICHTTASTAARITTPGIARHTRSTIPCSASRDSAIVLASMKTFRTTRAPARTRPYHRLRTNHATAAAGAVSAPTIATEAAEVQPCPPPLMNRPRKKLTPPETTPARMINTARAISRFRYMVLHLATLVYIAPAVSSRPYAGWHEYAC